MLSSKKALVIFSGGQDSTTCLLQAIRDYGVHNVSTITFQYGQRHEIELNKSQWIAEKLGVAQTFIDTSVIKAVTHSALTDASVTIEHNDGEPYPNSIVEGRNALFLLLAGCHAKENGITDIIIGVCETDFSGYPDCRDVFIKSMNVTLNLAMDYKFNVITPLMYLTKAETWALADQMGHLDFIREYTHTCYEGVDGGCGQCPSCQLREQGLATYLAEKSQVSINI